MRFGYSSSCLNENKKKTTTLRCRVCAKQRRKRAIVAMFLIFVFENVSFHLWLVVALNCLLELVVDVKMAVIKDDNDVFVERQPTERWCFWNETQQTSVFKLWPLLRQNKAQRTHGTMHACNVELLKGNSFALYEMCSVKSFCIYCVTRCARVCGFNSI